MGDRTVKAARAVKNGSLLKCISGRTVKSDLEDWQQAKLFIQLGEVVRGGLFR